MAGGTPPTRVEVGYAERLANGEVRLVIQSLALGCHDLIIEAEPHDERVRCPVCKNWVRARTDGHPWKHQHKGTLCSGVKPRSFVK